MGRRSRGFCGARPQLCLSALAGRCSYIRSPVRQRFDRASRAGKYSRYRIPVTIVPLQSPVTPPVPSSWRPSSEGRVRCCRCPADDWWPPHVGDTPRPCRWNPTRVMNWEASARREGQALLHRNLVTEVAGDVSFVGVGHIGIRALADFRQLYPLGWNEALVSRAFLAGFAAKRVRRGHERPLAREMVSRDLC